jgi:hypothetical protein
MTKSGIRRFKVRCVCGALPHTTHDFSNTCHGSLCTRTSRLPHPKHLCRTVVGAYVNAVPSYEPRVFGRRMQASSVRHSRQAPCIAICHLLSPYVHTTRSRCVLVLPFVCVCETV